MAQWTEVYENCAVTGVESHVLDALRYSGSEQMEVMPVLFLARLKFFLLHSSVDSGGFKPGEDIVNESVCCGLSCVIWCRQAFYPFGEFTHHSEEVLVST